MEATSPFKTNRFTRIQDAISQTRRMPRLGKIRLGIKLLSTKNPGKEYPKETEYFVVTPEVAKVYGEQPTELDVMFPVNDPEIVFPQQLEWYGSSKGLRCHGDKQKAERRQEDGSWKEMDCPCEHLKTDDNPKGECTERGHLLVLLPKVSMGGIYQIDTGSYHSIVDINSGIDMVRSLLHGRIAMVPLKLRRVKRETHADQKKQVHYTLSVILDASISEINSLIENSKLVIDRAATLQIEAPRLENVAADPPDALGDEKDEIEDAEIVTSPVHAATAAAPAPAEPQMSHQDADLHSVHLDLTHRIQHAKTVDEVNTELQEANVYPFSAQQMRAVQSQAADRVKHLTTKKK